MTLRKYSDAVKETTPTSINSNAPPSIHLLVSKLAKINLTRKASDEEYEWAVTSRSRGHKMCGASVFLDGKIVNPTSISFVDNDSMVVIIYNEESHEKTDKGYKTKIEGQYITWCEGFQYSAKIVIHVDQKLAGLVKATMYYTGTDSVKKSVLVSVDIPAFASIINEYHISLSADTDLITHIRVRGLINDVKNPYITDTTYGQITLDEFKCTGLRATLNYTGGANKCLIIPCSRTTLPSMTGSCYECLGFTTTRYWIPVTLIVT